MEVTRRSFMRFMAGLGVLALPAAGLLPRLPRRHVVDAVRRTAFPGRVVALPSVIPSGEALAG